MESIGLGGGNGLSAVAAPTATFPGILVVESSPDLQWRIARTLTVRGHRVVGTSSGEGALALFDQWPVELVLLDADLAGMSADSLVEQLHAMHPGLPVIAMVRAECAGRDLPRSCAAYLRRPFVPDALLQTVERLAATRSRGSRTARD